VLPELTWNAVSGESLPESNPQGDPLDIYFNNKSGQPVDIFRLDATGKPHPYGTLERGWFKPYQAKSGEVWLVTDKQNKRLGYYLIGNETAEAIIPSE